MLTFRIITRIIKTAIAIFFFVTKLYFIIVPLICKEISQSICIKVVSIALPFLTSS